MGELLPAGTKKNNCAGVKLGLESRGMKEDFRFPQKNGLPLRPVDARGDLVKTSSHEIACVQSPSRTLHPVVEISDHCPWILNKELGEVPCLARATALN
jgi:hypothetical protein